MLPVHVRELPLRHQRPGPPHGHPALRALRSHEAHHDAARRGGRAADELVPLGDRPAGPGAGGVPAGGAAGGVRGAVRVHLRDGGGARSGGGVVAGAVQGGGDGGGEEGRAEAGQAAAAVP